MPVIPLLIALLTVAPAAAPIAAVAADAAPPGDEPTPGAVLDASGDIAALAAEAAAAERAGDAAGAVERILRAAPAFARDGRFAPLLYDAGRLLEGPLADPQRALAVYDDVIARFPAHRFAARARDRAQYLRGVLAGGVAAYTAYEQLRATPLPETGDDPTAAALARFIDENPTFPLVFDARFQLVERYLRRRAWAAAERTLDEIDRAAVDEQQRTRATLTRAWMLAETGRLDAAVALYERVAATGSDYLQREAAVDRGFDARVNRLRAWMAPASAAWLPAAGLTLAALVWRARRTLFAALWPPPFEVMLAVPWVVSAATAARRMESHLGWACVLLMAQGMVLMWAAAALIRARPPAAGPIGPAALFAWSLLLLPTGVAAAFVTLESTDLTLTLVRNLLLPKGH